MVPTDRDMALINQFTRHVLNKNDVYIFSLVLCDNDIDRDFECFTKESLYELEKLFVGKTGILGQYSSFKNQTARIFECSIEQVKDRKTALGEPYNRLVAKAFIVKTDSNMELIQKLSSEFIKEVSIGCAVQKVVCSICENSLNSSNCNHKKGKRYKKKLCCGKLTDISDAYEFSLVVNPKSNKE